VNDCQFAYITQIGQKQKQNKTWDTDKVKKHENRRKKRSLKNKKDSTRGPKEMKIHDCPKKNTMPGSILKKNNSGLLSIVRKGCSEKGQKRFL